MTTTLPHLPGSPPDAVTRCLCHAVHLRDDLRDYILHTVVDPHMRAVCPAFGVNLVAIARHAVLAQRRFDTRQRLLMAIRAVALTALVLGFILQSLTVAVGLLLPSVLAAWGVLAWFLRSDQLNALRAVTDLQVPPQDQAPPLPTGTEDWLREVDQANVIVYANGEGDPFIGSGRRLHFAQLQPVDVTRTGQDINGNKLTLKPFDAITLHEYLAKKVPAMGFTDLRAKNRLYVRGDYARHVPGLLPDPFTNPRAQVRPSILKSAVQEPKQRARTYVCMERVMASGQLVVGMYVRAWLEQDLLSIERVLYFLPPLRNYYRPTRDLMARGKAGATLDAIVTSTRRVLPVLVGKPVSGKHRINFGAMRREAEARGRREIKKGYVFDYGARTSLREAVAGYDTNEHFDEADVLDGVKRLSRRLLDSIQEFLDDHGIDTSDFKQQVQLINNSVSNIGSIQAGTAVVGGQGNIVTGHGAVNNFGYGQSAAQPGAGIPQATP